MQIKVDTHTHTLASGHAYNTMREMAETALEKGLEALAITEHAPEMPGSCCLYYFQNLKVVPRKRYEIPLLLGAELNIMDEHGNVDLPISTIKSLDITIASIHPPCYGKDAGLQQNTAAYVNAMHKDYIDIIGHPDDGRFPADYEILQKQPKRPVLCWKLIILPKTGWLPHKHTGKCPGNFKILQKIWDHGYSRK